MAQKKQKKLTEAQMRALALMAQCAVEGREHVRVGGNVNEGREITQRTAESLDARGLIDRVVNSVAWRPEVRLTKEGILLITRLMDIGSVLLRNSPGHTASIVRRLLAGEAYTKRLDVRWNVDLTEGAHYMSSPVGGGGVYRLDVPEDVGEAELRKAVADLYTGHGWDHIHIVTLLLRDEYERADAEVAAIQAAATVILDSAQTKLDCVINRTAPVTAQVYLDDAEAALVTAEKEWARAVEPALTMQRSLNETIPRSVRNMRHAIERKRKRLADPTENAVRVAARHLQVEAGMKVGVNGPDGTTVTVTADEFRRLVTLAYNYVQQGNSAEPLL